MRRFRAAAAAFATLVLLAVTASAATAQNFPPSEPGLPRDPGGSRFTVPAEGETVTTDKPTIAGEFRSAVPLSDVEVKIGFARDDIAGCRLPGAASVRTVEVEPTRYAFDHAPTFECNGTYQVTAIARDGRSGDVEPISAEIGPRQFTVAAPPAPVIDLAVVVNPDRTVTVTWAPGGDGPDYQGYEVVRSRGGDAAAASPSEATTFNDTQKAPPEGKLSYTVVALRSDGAGDVIRSEAAVSGVDLSEVTDPTVPPGDGPGSGAGSGRGGSSGSGGSGGSSSSGSASGRSGPPTTLDTGFDEEIDYGDRELGAADAVLPDDLASTQRFNDGSEPRGLLVPVALALVLVLGAMHLRHLTRLATRPALVPVAPMGPRLRNRPPPPPRQQLGPPLRP
ncbi:hypothetical protein BH20ACT2_BH20ACT2_25720 [soil metagenome]